MKLSTIIVLSQLLLSSLSLAWAAEPAISKDDPPVEITESNPEREVGYHVGDVLQRTITLKVADTYHLLPTSLPLVGNQKKYRNKDQGIEIYSSKMSESHRGGFNIYTLVLNYQVFSSSIVAKPAALPPEFVKFAGNGKLFRVRIPSWSFRISPLAVYGSVKIEKDMSQLRGPLLLDDSVHRQALNTAIGVLSFSLLGLLYILGNRSWLPRMGGPFAKANRKVRKSSDDDHGIKSAISSLHQAFNQSSGQSVFTASEFISQKPGFSPIREEIEQFFLLSRAVFFDASTPSAIQDPPPIWLRKFSRRCRDCERGLK
ncbi:hypothetical protein LG201_01430 [Methylobacillus gramineus]|uniref:hypothetical protein n=1 Tax=Methylobacillus gramineus TaxID=755169 RepID=UPI001CFF9E62|nr:hypothetical protein [Methylobacillus gramineus]MCB5183862.1 hypothetical protein [Methylobacillus gramineus]